MTEADKRKSSWLACKLINLHLLTNKSKTTTNRQCAHCDCLVLRAEQAVIVVVTCEACIHYACWCIPSVGRFNVICKGFRIRQHAHQVLLQQRTLHNCCCLAISETASSTYVGSIVVYVGPPAGSFRFALTGKPIAELQCLLLHRLQACISSSQ